MRGSSVSYYAFTAKMLGLIIMSRDEFFCFYSENQKKNEREREKEEKTSELLLSVYVTLAKARIHHRYTTFIKESDPCRHVQTPFSGTLYVTYLAVHLQKNVFFLFFFFFFL